MSLTLEIVQSGQSTLFWADHQGELVLMHLHNTVSGGSLLHDFFEPMEPEEIPPSDTAATVNFDEGRVQFCASDLFLVREDSIAEVMDRIPAKKVPKKLRKVFSEYHSLDKKGRDAYAAELYEKSMHAELSKAFYYEEFDLEIETFLRIFQNIEITTGYD